MRVENGPAWEGSVPVFGAIGLLASLEISSDTPSALCPPPERARQAIAERVGEVDASISVRYGVVHRGAGGAISLHIDVSTPDECGPKLSRDYPIESGSCDDASEVLATVAEGFITDPPIPAQCSKKNLSLHVSADLSTAPSFGGSVGLSGRFPSGFSLGAWGTLAGTPSRRVRAADNPTYSDIEVWTLGGRLLFLGEYTISLGSRVETDLALGAGPGFDLGQPTSGAESDMLFSRFVLLTEAQSRWRYRFSAAWALELAVKGSWYFYRMPAELVVKHINDQDAVEYTTTNIEPLPALQASLSLGMAYRF